LLGGRSNDVVPALREMLLDEQDNEVLNAASDALEELARPAAPAVEGRTRTPF
jgi:hypothetical protein